MTSRMNAAPLALGLNTPTKRDALETDRVPEEGGSDGLFKPTSTAMARLALLGIEVRGFGADAWMLSYGNGVRIGLVRGIDALTAAAEGFEAARADVQAMVGRLGRAGDE